MVVKIIFIFTRVNLSDMASKQLESEIWRYAKSLHDKKDWPAMVVGAEYGQLRSKKKSGCPCSLHRTLYKKLAP